MILYGREIELSRDSINIEQIEVVPCEGSIIPLDYKSIEGLEEQLYQTGFIDNKKIIKKIYIHLDDEFEKGNLCIIYKNKKLRIVPKVGFEITHDDIQVILQTINNSKAT